jgi:hypothetical protein
MKFLVALAAIMAIAAGAAHAQAWLNTAREGNHPPAAFLPPPNPVYFELMLPQNQEKEITVYHRLAIGGPKINFKSYPQESLKPDKDIYSRTPIHLPDKQMIYK